MDLETDKIKKFILEELIKKSKFGGSHTPLDNVINHLPEEFFYNKKGKRLIEDAIKGLNNQGWILILKKRTGKGSDLHISINPRAIKEISAFFELNR